MKADLHLAPSLWEGFTDASLLRIGGMFEAVQGEPDAAMKLVA